MDKILSIGRHVKVKTSICILRFVHESKSDICAQIPTDKINVIIIDHELGQLIACEHYVTL